jgi:hypothetical protein
MKEIYSRLYIGGDPDYLKVADDPDWRVLRATKEGEGGHRSLLGYTERAAPLGKDYLHAKKGRVLALNLIDADSADYIPNAALDTGLDYISESLRLGHKVLVACNRGESRAPSLGLLWLVQNGKLPANFSQALRQFKSLYPDYDPAPGIRQAVKTRISKVKHGR